MRVHTYAKTDTPQSKHSNSRAFLDIGSVEDGIVAGSNTTGKKADLLNIFDLVNHGFGLNAAITQDLKATRSPCS